MWRGKAFEQLNEKELKQAMTFYQTAYNELIAAEAPPSCWGFISEKLSALTMVQVSRLGVK